MANIKYLAADEADTRSMEQILRDERIAGSEELHRLEQAVMKARVALMAHKGSMLIVPPRTKADKQECAARTAALTQAFNEASAAYFDFKATL